RKVFKGEYEFPPWFSPEAKKLISKLLVADPEKRITISAVTKIPWFIKEFSRSSSFSSIEENNTDQKQESKEPTKKVNFQIVCAKEFKVKMQGTSNGRKGKLSVMAEVFEVAPEVTIVEFSKSAGDTLEY
ncbi:hypothetical protein MTR67_028571, partial [Solanum verrucosum]